MKLPAVAITAAFACGVALGLCPPIVRLATSHFWVAAGFVAAAFLIGVAVLLLNRARFGEAAVVVGINWMVLGALGAWISEQPLPGTHVISMIENGRIDLRTPLRWRGTLRDEPAKLPWGYGLEIELAGVEYQSMELAAVGGLRVSFSPRPEDTPLPVLHAGDEVTVLAQAKRPQIFRDEGAFVALQIGMLPLMARDFHRITLAAPFANLAAVPLTGIVVPLGFATLGSAMLIPSLAKMLAVPLASVTLALLHVVHWFARLPKWSYRIPGPRLWIVIAFFTFALLLAAACALLTRGAEELRRG